MRVTFKQGQTFKRPLVVFAKSAPAEGAQFFLSRLLVESKAFFFEELGALSETVFDCVAL